MGGSGVYRQILMSFLTNNWQEYMRFGKNIRHLAIPQWKQCYIDYEHLKIFIQLIKKIVQIIHSCDKHLTQLSTHIDEQSSLNPEPLEDPLLTCRKDLLKLGERVNQLFCVAHIKSMGMNRLFFHMKLLEMRSLFAKCQAVHDMGLQTKELSMLMEIVEFIYVETSLVENAKILNLEGERKILKKHIKYADGFFETPRSRNKKVLRVKKGIEKLLYDQEEFYIKNVGGVTKTNRQKLRELAKKAENSNCDSFIFGSWIGICICIIGVLITILVYSEKSIETDFVFNRDFPTWRGIALFILYIWILGLNVYGFEYYSISHRVIFQYNEHHYSTSTDIFKIAGFFSTFFLIMFSVYTLQIASIIDLVLIYPYYLVLFVWGLFILYLINPFPIFSFRSRLYALKIAVRSILAPFLGVTFPVIWMTDQLVTLITPFKDTAYTICYYMNITSDENSVNSSWKRCNSASRVEVVLVVGAVTYFFRISQCIRQGYDKGKYFFEPQFFNTIKYAFSLMTLILSFLWKAGNDTIFYAWIVFAVGSTLYSYVWDVKIDWALFEANSPNRFLRKNLYYPLEIYYVILIVNFVFRIAWVATLSPSITNNAFGSPQIFSLVTGFIQIMRRGIWNMLRVEKQHMANCLNFKATPSTQKSFQNLIMNSLANRNKNEGRSISLISQQSSLNLDTIQKEEKEVGTKHLEHLRYILDLELQEKIKRAAKAQELSKEVKKIDKRVKEIFQNDNSSKGGRNQVTPLP